MLPYLYQGGVEQYGWLTGPQMIDGLALGETTPGPLIMVVAFVGFVGGWTKQAFGPDALALAGIAGAFVAAFFTFLPSFLFILVGGPLVEATHGEIKFHRTAHRHHRRRGRRRHQPGVFFAWHVLWPLGTPAQPFAGGFEWASALIGLAAAVALFRFRVGIVPVIGACAVLGLAYALFL
ncbi:MAG: chromate transporter [Rhodocyclaceae bacterium]|nr:chromate transporter [Rhodocyclaceae bacterium]